MNVVIEGFRKWKSRLLTSILELYLLDLIAIQERYPGELVIMSQKVLGQDVKVPTVYAIVRRNLQSGFLELEEKGSEDGITRGTSRNYYKLTEDGISYHTLLRNEIKLIRDKNIFSEDSI